MLIQIVVAFTLFGVLQGTSTVIRQQLAATRADHLYVSGAGPLPIAHVEQIRKIRGVVHANARSGWSGIYRTPDQPVGGNATDLDEALRIEENLHVPPEQVEALKQLRTGAVVGDSLMAKYGWKVGDRVSFKSPLPRADGTDAWAFDIVGVYTQDRFPDQALGIFINYEYLNEARLEKRDTADSISVLIDNPSDAARVSHEIDAHFANSPDPTRTQSETELLQSQLEQVGDIGFVTTTITGAAFLGLLFATSAVMMQSVRERVPELGVLKAIGFSDRRIMGFVLGEAVLLCVVGAVVGLWIAAILMPRQRIFFGGIGPVPGVVFVEGLACAGMVALVSAAVPAWRALRLTVASTLQVR
jgi:putative ABC transport system permease protein